MQNEQDDRLYKSGFWVTVCLTILIIAGIIGGGIIQNSFAKHEVLGTSTVSPTPPPPAGGPTPSQDFLTGVPESSDSADITPTVRLTLTPTPTLHPTSTSTPTPKPTESPTPTPTSPPSPTLTPSPTPTETPIPTL